MNLRKSDVGQFCLLTSHEYPLGYGGEETFLRQFTEFLRSQGFTYTVISTAPSRSMSVDPVRLPKFSVPLFGFEVYSFLFIMLAVLKIVKINSKKRIGILYSVETGYAGLAAVLGGIVLGLPIIIHSHTRRGDALKNIRGSKHDWRTWPYWAFERFLDRTVSIRATRAIAVSADVKNYLNNLGVPNGRILVASSAVETARFRVKGEVMKWRRRMGLEVFVVGYLGRLEKIKGVNVLLDAFVDFSRRSHRPSYLVIAGDGKDRTDFERHVTNEHIPNVLFIGYQNDVPAFLRSINIFAFPSFQEGSPIALLEAMAAGCPIVATRIPGVVEIAEDCAILVPPGVPIAFTNALIRLESDAELREKLAKAAAVKGSNFSTGKIMSEILEFCLSAHV